MPQLAWEEESLARHEPMAVTLYSRDGRVVEDIDGVRARLLPDRSGFDLIRRHQVVQDHHIFAPLYHAEHRVTVDTVNVYGVCQRALAPPEEARVGWALVHTGDGRSAPWRSSAAL
jgi:hypothetical protein